MAAIIRTSMELLSSAVPVDAEHVMRIGQRPVTEPVAQDCPVPSSDDVKGFGKEI